MNLKYIKRFCYKKKKKKLKCCKIRRKKKQRSEFFVGKIHCGRRKKGDKESSYSIVSGVAYIICYKRFIFN